MMVQQLKAAHARQAPEPTPIVFAMVLSISIGTALTLLLAWHVYLVLTAQVQDFSSPTRNFPEMCEVVVLMEGPGRAIKQPRQAATSLSVSQQRPRLDQLPYLTFHVARSPCRSILTHSSVATQGTIEFHNNRKLRRAAHASGGAWVNPYDLGPAANWQVSILQHLVRCLLLL